MRNLPLILLSSLLCSGATLAQDPVLYNGGVGSDERERVSVKGTRLEFFVRGGAYLAGVQVSIRDARNRELVNLVTEGPWLILDLPAGRYQLEASLAADKVLRGSFDVGDGEQQFAFMFETQ